MLEFLPLTTANYHRHEVNILASEEIFPEEIRETSATYLEALQQKGVQAFVARFQGDYAGNVVGFPLSPGQQRALRFHEVETCLDGLIYLFNIVAMPDFQGQGVGKRMLAHFLHCSTEAGFQKVGGHFRGNGSLTNFLKLGGEELASFDNWFGTGEAYSYCELDLGREYPSD